MTLIKLTFRTILRFIRDLDGLFTYLTSFFIKRHYTVDGACKKRGICCQNIAIGIHPRLGTFKQFIIAYYEFVYNFQFIHYLAKDQVLLFKCNYLKGATCSIHWKRPYICRQYPYQKSFITPSVLPGCGYHITSQLNKFRNSI